MSRYTGPSYKKSRTVGFSTLENGKDVKSYGKDVNDEYIKEVVYSVGPKPIR